MSTEASRIDDPFSHVGTACSTRGLLMEYQKEKGLEDPISGRQFFAILEEDETAQKVLDGFAQGIAFQILDLYWLLDLEKVAIGGGISRQKVLIDRINEHFDRLSSMGPTKKYHLTIETQIVQAQFGNEANQIGAFMTYLEERGNAL